MGLIQVIGSGATITDATENAFDRAGTLLAMTEDEVRGRCTFTGGVLIGQLPGVVQFDCSLRWSGSKNRDSHRWCVNSTIWMADTALAPLLALEPIPTKKSASRRPSRRQRY
ncbi:acetamidase/formamidase [Natrialba chahannaoensis JCM 10990]|uniref:Acetamidase/formamidase n=1 Tax=Natrialba chahannaoensis JCM 10990 TaxID=1227492 RepID=M0A9M7_9EURY|nr:acetamidase/formamidase [Natrialba chahannaoensis JCM 10990]